ncbi:MAG: hypothetical protein JWN65_2097 [Solirubrobacterales bacterium]|nr:hypothetical protein [Solirubrobacterales bacterium]
MYITVHLHPPVGALNDPPRPPTTQQMSVEAVMARITAIQGALGPVAAPAPAPAAALVSTPVTGQSATFASLLGQAGGPAPAGVSGVAGAVPVRVAGATDAGSRMIAMAQAELQAGVAEQPPGSNDAPRIAEYRSATAGGGVGPWCAYFVSWLARQAGTPVGEAGQGFGNVDALRGWAERTGRTTGTPAPGELVVWDEHIGLVTGVDPDGTVRTIEGNSSNAVSARSYGPDGGGALTYVKL